MVNESDTNKIVLCKNSKNSIITMGLQTEIFNVQVATQLNTSRERIPEREREREKKKKKEREICQ